MGDRTGEVRTVCRSCGHVWLLVRLPMELRAVVAIMKRAKCPSCSGSELALAPSRDLTDMPAGRAPAPENEG